MNVVITSTRCSTFGLILESRSVMKLLKVPKYATLSYVWGPTKDSDLQATKDNVHELESDGYLFDNEGIPTAITDAMTVCSNLGIHFLWVDRLCIVQDSMEEKRAQINAMGRIYGHACLIIAQFQGEGAHDGLAGVSKPRETTTDPYQTRDVYLLREYDQYQVLCSRSKWATRGWTFQEAFLSSRVLLFSDQGVIFECYDGEKIHMEDRDMRETEWSDGGMYNTRIPPKGEVFPSWSWVSIKGPVSFWRPDGMPVTNLAIWAVASDNLSLRFIRPPISEPSVPGNKDHKMKLLVALVAWRNGCFPSKLPAVFEPDARWQHYVELIEARWSSIDELCTDALGIDRHTLTVPDLHERISSELIRLAGQQPGRIMVHTSSLILKVDPQLLQEGVACFRTEDGREVGRQNNMKQGELRRFSEALDTDPDTQFEALGLALSASAYYKNIEGLWRDSTGAALYELRDPEGWPDLQSYDHAVDYPALRRIDERVLECTSVDINEMFTVTKTRYTRSQTRTFTHKSAWNTASPYKNVFFRPLSGCELGAGSISAPAGLKEG
ncbi:HET-domain-containing protein [Aspergillus sclerotioniger CBS 115572]|uniref:HET-domain-containing protein n=1 Tax=Aspergillus sclerotioniger CBS 115572 TaxID=1450535 RepID=A0A317WV85_9EURO|nr:HET-domain-containing protein [Aspergillus sclerotioniger CBS 115572]PWY90334.1 HET-domain-containing protein [Aspergillus sclerotioniger CBS 115572]